MADGHAVGVVELHARAGHFIQVRRAVGFPTVTLEHLLPHVVGEDEEDVGLLVFRLRHARSRQGQAKQAGEDEGNFRSARRCRDHFLATPGWRHWADWSPCNSSA